MAGYQEDTKGCFTLKMSKQNIIKHIRSLLFDLVIMTVMIAVFYILFNEWNLFILIIVGYYIVNLAPAVYLFYEHYNQSKGVLLEINMDEIKFLNLGTSIKFEDVSGVTLFCPFSDIRESSIRFSSVENYSFLRIESNNIKYNISCLMMNDLNNLFELFNSKNKEKIGTLFPSMRFYGNYK